MAVQVFHKTSKRCPVNCFFNLNKILLFLSAEKLLTFQTGSSLSNCQKFRDGFLYILKYSIELHIGITTSISCTSSTCTFFVPLMQLVNGAQFLNVSFLFLLFGYSSCVAVLRTFIIPLKYIYAPLQSHKFDFIIEGLNLIWLLALYVPRDSSFISAEFLALNLDHSILLSCNVRVSDWIYTL